jgi:hypothetical protein
MADKNTAVSLYEAMEALREGQVDVPAAREAVQSAWEAFRRFEKRMNEVIAMVPDDAKRPDPVVQTRRFAFTSEPVEVIGSWHDILRPFAELADQADEFGHYSGTSSMWRIDYDDLERARKAYRAQGTEDPPMNSLVC